MGVVVTEDDMMRSVVKNFYECMLRATNAFVDEDFDKAAVIANEAIEMLDELPLTPVVRLMLSSTMSFLRFVDAE
jgi:hypothetical protein